MVGMSITDKIKLVLEKHIREYEFGQLVDENLLGRLKLLAEQQLSRFCGLGFEVTCDLSNNKPEDIDRHTLHLDITFKGSIELKT